MIVPVFHSWNRIDYAFFIFINRQTAKRNGGEENEKKKFEINKIRLEWCGVICVNVR